jgi:hypothetical protein
MEFPIALLVPLLFVIIGPVFWCAVVGFLSLLGGWSRLGSRYATDKTPRGTALRWQTGAVGLVSYRNVLKIDVAQDGLFLAMPWPFRIGHPPLFIPWSAVQGATATQMLWLRQVRFGVGKPAIAHLRLPAKVFEITDAGRAALGGDGTTRR